MSRGGFLLFLMEGLLQATEPEESISILPRCSEIVEMLLWILIGFKSLSLRLVTMCYQGDHQYFYEMVDGC